MTINHCDNRVLLDNGMLKTDITMECFKITVEDPSFKAKQEELSLLN